MLKNPSLQTLALHEMEKFMRFNDDFQSHIVACTMFNAMHYTLVFYFLWKI